MENTFDNENLLFNNSKTDIKWYQGPIKFLGSNQYGVVNRIRKFYSYLKILTLPDSTTKTLMIDNMKKIDFSSFLKNGNILLRCDY